LSCSAGTRPVNGNAAITFALVAWLAVQRRLRRTRHRGVQAMIDSAYAAKVLCPPLCGRPPTAAS